MDINKVTLIGRLVRNPEARTVPSGQHLTTCTVATNYVWRDLRTKEKKDKSEFHKIVAWGKLADIMQQYLVKGSRVYIEGRLTYRDWQDAKGQKRTNTDVIADELIILSPSAKARAAQQPLPAVEEPSEKELVTEEA